MPKNPVPLPEAEGPAESDRRIGAAIRKLFESDPSASVHLYGLPDAEDGPYLVGGHSTAGELRRYASEDSLVNAAEKLADNQRTKACRTCGTKKFLNQFARHPKSPDGRAYDCVDCRRNERVVGRVLRRGAKKRPRVTARGS